MLQLLEDVVALKAENAALREEIARLKGLEGPPKLKPSGMEKATEPARAERKAGRRGGKIDRLVIDEERVLKAAVPPGSRFKGYGTYVVQELILRPHVIRYRRERWITPDGRTVVAALPVGTVGHFGPELRRFVLAQYHPGQVTVPRIVAQLRDLGMAISKRQGVRLLIAGKEDFLAEAAGVLKSGLESAAWITVDDTGARYKGMNGACTHIGNTDFAWFATTRAKSRLNFLALLRAGATDYVINDEALAYMRGRSLSGLVIARLAGHKSKRLKDQEAWMAHLERLGITRLRVHPDPLKIATEGALWGSVVAHGLLKDAVIVSDDAGQFNVGSHALCWVHAERLIHKLVGFNHRQRQACARIRARRVVGKAEHLPGGANLRFVVTSLPRTRIDARALYEDLYCARGEMENRIKEQQLDLFAERTSSATMKANQLRLWFSSIAYVLLNELRRIALRHTRFAEATCGTIRLKLLKIGALVRRSVRRIKFAMASGFPWHNEFALAYVYLERAFPR